MALLFEDRFDRADAFTLGSPWIVPTPDDDGWGIISNQARFRLSGPTIFDDDFERADASTLGSPWTAHSGTWGVLSGNARYEGGAAVAAAATVDIGVTAKTIVWDWTQVGPGPTYMVIRYVDINNMVFISGTGDGPTLFLHERVSGVNTIIASLSDGYSNPVRVDDSGTVITVSRPSDNAQLINHATTRFNTSQRCGIAGNAASVTPPLSDSHLDRFTVTEFRLHTVVPPPAATVVDIGRTAKVVEWEHAATARGPFYHIVRWVDEDNFVFVAGTNTGATIFIFETIAGVQTTVASGSGGSWGAGDVIRVEDRNPLIRVSLNSDFVFDHSTTAHQTSTLIGMGGNSSASDTSVRLDVARIERVTVRTFGRGPRLGLYA